MFRAIFNRCLATEDSKKDPNDTISVQVLDKKLTSKESEPVLLSKKQLKSNHMEILYLLGQIHLFHKKIIMSSLCKMVFINMMIQHGQKIMINYFNCMLFH